MLYRAWADEFTSSRTYIQAQTSNFISTRHFWDGSNFLNRWSSVGVQSVPGRSNANEQVQTDLRDNGCCVCTNATVTLSRWRIYPAPSQASSCSQAGLSFVGSAIHSKNTCQFNLADSYVSHQNLPQMNFSAESGVTTNADTGYRSRVSVQTGTNSSTKDGCFVIRWIP